MNTRYHKQGDNDTNRSHHEREDNAQQNQNPMVLVELDRDKQPNVAVPSYEYSHYSKELV